MLWPPEEFAAAPISTHLPDPPDVATKENTAHFTVITPKASGPVAPSARQPIGALSGRVVFMNSGHGWTWSTNGFWYLQRPAALAGMNEDCGNLDQLNFFAQYCFNAGAIVASMRPIGQQTNEVVLDNTNAAVSYAGTWSSSSSTYYFGTAGATPYRFASLAATETATATYTPTIPVAGYYPVYTWVKADTDRGDQLYRIRHTGGETLYRVPHYMVGNGWIYLGEYFFNAGSNSLNGAVVISNLRETANGSVVIADAIRFGNGMGSINQGGGVSGYPREEESCRYWVQASIGRGQSSVLYNDSDSDEHDSWHTPPLMSVEMCKTNGSAPDNSRFFKRVHISFHSNASTGNTNTATSRGVEGLITGNPTPNQVALAQICGQSVNDELVSLGSPPLEVPWKNRGTNIIFEGGYSEISNTDFQNAMDATILEVGYHDNTLDSALMRDPKVRAAIARAAMHGVVKYFNQFDTASPPPLIFPPEPPANVRAIGAANGNVSLAWEPPVSVANTGAPTNYVIFFSTNGYGFGNPISVGNLTNYIVTGLTTGLDYYFRVEAANAGGESFPSEVVGCRTPSLPGAAKILFVNGFDRFDRSTDLKQNLSAQNYVPPGAVGGTDRVLPHRINAFDYVVPHGKAISAYGMAFDTAHHRAVAGGLVALTNYPIVIWAAGNESINDETFTAAEQLKVATYLTNGGHLFVSGAEIAYDLDRPSGPTTADRNFLRNQLHAAYVTDSSSSWNFSANAASLFAGATNGAFDNGSRGIYMVPFPDVIAPTNYGAWSAINYSNVVSGAAGIFYNGSAGGGRVVYLGFPFETIIGEATRNAYMAKVLNFFNAGALKFDSIVVNSAQAQLAMSGPAGIYMLQTGAVLGVWSPRATLTNTSGSMTFTNSATTSSDIFFRLKSFP